MCMHAVLCQTVFLSRVIGVMLWLTTSRLRRWCGLMTLLSGSASLSSTTHWARSASRMGQNNTNTHMNTHINNHTSTFTQRNLKRKVIKSCESVFVSGFAFVCICRHFQEAADMFSLAIQYNPTASHYYESRSKVFRKLLNLKAARQDFICMQVLDPTNEEVWASASRSTNIFLKDCGLLKHCIKVSFNEINIILTFPFYLGSVSKYSKPVLRYWLWQLSSSIILSNLSYYAFS